MHTLYIGGTAAFSSRSLEAVKREAATARSFGARDVFIMPACYLIR